MTRAVRDVPGHLRRSRRVALPLRSELRLVGHAAWRGFTGLINGDDFTFASSISYYSLLSLFPCFMLLFAVLGAVTADPADRNAVLGFVLRYFPAQFDFVTTQLETLERTKIQLGVVGTIAITWASLGFFRAITSAVNYAWGVEKQRSYLKHQLVSFVMLLCAGVLLLVTILLLGIIDVVQATWFARLSYRIPGLQLMGALTGLAFRYAATLFLILVVGLIFYFLPNAKVRFRDVWMGAIFTGLLWRGAYAAFAWYIKNPLRLSVHGSIATVVAFLIWVYVSAVILLYGVEFTAAYARVRLRRPAAIPAAPAPRT